MRTVSSRWRGAVALLALPALLVAKDAGPTTVPAAHRLRLATLWPQNNSPWLQAAQASIGAELVRRGHAGQNTSFATPDERERAAATLLRGRPDVLVLYPDTAADWGPTMKLVKDAGVPVVFLTRPVDEIPPGMASTVLANDYAEEGRRAGAWLAKKTDGKAVVFELRGVERSAPAEERGRGLAEAIKPHAGITVFHSAAADFDREKAKAWTETMLKDPAGAKVTAIFAHNDDMAAGAIEALENAGKKPGRDVLVVSIDGTRAAVKLIGEGKLNCSVECAPPMGRQLFDVIERLAAGEAVPKRVAIEETLFDETNVKADSWRNRPY